MLCTSDKDLALVWCGLNLSQFVFGEGPASAKSAPLLEFLPAAAGQFCQRLLAEPDARAVAA